MVGGLGKKSEKRAGSCPRASQKAEALEGKVGKKSKKRAGSCPRASQKAEALEGKVGKKSKKRAGSCPRAPQKAEALEEKVGKKSKKRAGSCPRLRKLYNYSEPFIRKIAAAAAFLLLMKYVSPYEFTSVCSFVQAREHPKINSHGSE